CLSRGSPVTGMAPLHPPPSPPPAPPDPRSPGWRSARRASDAGRHPRSVSSRTGAKRRRRACRRSGTSPPCLPPLFFQMRSCAAPAIDSAQLGLQDLAVIVLRQGFDRDVGLRPLEAGDAAEAERVELLWRRLP